MKELGAGVATSAKIVGVAILCKTLRFYSGITVYNRIKYYCGFNVVRKPHIVFLTLPFPVLMVYLCVLALRLSGI